MRKISIPTKLSYGVGQVAEQIKVQGFDAFVFFYFNQILGLEGWLTGAAVAGALMVDAVTDPMIGSISDNFRSKYGRRHPFMFAAALPLGLFWALLFFPPNGLDQLGLFIWLLGFAILIRSSMTLYHVPHLALGAEMSDDYHERTSIVSYRVMFGVIGGAMTTIISLTYFFPETAGFQNPLLNAEGYPKVAIFGGVVMTTTILISAIGTLKEVPHLPSAPLNPTAFSLKRVYGEFNQAWNNPSFRAIFLGVCFSAISYGVTQTLATHMNVFFWKFSPSEIAMLAAVYVPGFFTAGAIAQILHKKFDKKTVLIIAAMLVGLLANLGVALNLLGLFPVDEKGTAAIEVVMVFVFILSFSMALIFISAASMMADIAQEHLYETGKSQQGIFLSATAFSAKLASGIGHLVSGIGISFIEFPVQATDPTQVPSTLIQQLALLYLAGSLVGLFAILFFNRYRITKERFAIISQVKANKMGETSTEEASSADKSLEPT